MAVALLTTGYVLGAGGAFRERALTAQDSGPALSDNTREKIRAAQAALQEAADALKVEGRYESVTEELNAFLILAGGGNAQEDLEGGKGVDPETYAALNAGQATDEVKEFLDIDEDGRLTYNGQVVRMYSRSRLRQMYADRLALTKGL